MKSMNDSMMISKSLDQLSPLEQFERSMAYATPLMYMSMRGIKADTAEITQLRKEVEERLLTLEEEINTVAGLPVNVNSPKQIATLLYTIRGNKVIYNKEGRVTADETALAKLARVSSDSLPKLIVKARRYSKLIGTYLTGLVAEDGRCHTTYNLGRTTSGRLNRFEQTN